MIEGLHAGGATEVHVVDGLEAEIRNLMCDVTCSISAAQHSAARLAVRHYFDLVAPGAYDAVARSSACTPRTEAVVFCVAYVQVRHRYNHQR